MAKATDILDDIDAATHETDRISIGGVNDHLAHRGTGALLAVPASLELTPLGGIPGVPTLLALIVATFAVQVLAGRRDMWLPAVLEHRQVRAERVRASVARLRPAAKWSDRHLGRHLTPLTSAVGTRMAAAAVLLLCLMVPPLELVPFASSIPMGTIVLFGVALTVRDGRVMALAWLAFAAAIWGVWTILSEAALA